MLPLILRREKMEIEILDFIQTLRTPFGDWFFPLVTKLGNAGIIWIILALILLIIPKTRKYGAIVAIALIADLILCNGILKNLVARTRPFDVNTAVELLIKKPTDYSFPSGHTAAAFAAVTGLFLTKQKKLWIPSLVLALILAFSRLYLYVHYPTDILGGMVVGIISGCIGYFVVKKLEKRKNKNIIAPEGITEN